MNRPCSTNHTIQLIATLFVAAAIRAAAARTAPLPGTINYVEGEVTIDGEALPISDEPVALNAGQSVQVGDGRAEILLTPGVFLRLGDQTELRMIQPGGSTVAAELLEGDALLEVNAPAKETVLVILMDGATVNITKPGLYMFNAGQHTISVAEGEAIVHRDQEHMTLKKGRSVTLIAGQELKGEELDAAAMENDPLFEWSRQRSALEEQTGLLDAQAIDSGGAAYDWYWDAPLGCFVFLPSSGSYYSAFGGTYAGRPVTVRRPPHIIYHPVNGSRVLSGNARPIRTNAPAPHGSTAPHSGGGGHVGGGGGGGGSAHSGGGGGGGGGGRR